MITHQVLRQQEFQFAASDSVILVAEGAVIDTVAPGSVALVGGEQTISAAESSDYTQFFTASDSVTVFDEGAVVFTAAPGSVTLVGGEQAISIAESANYTQFFTASDSATVFAEGAVINTVAPGSVALVGGEQSIGITENADAKQFFTASETASVFAEGSVVSTQAPPGANIVGGEQSISVTESSSYSTGYSNDFFSTNIGETATLCGGTGCETNIKSDFETDSGASGAANRSLTVTYTLGTVTSNSSGFVEIRALDGSGSTLSSKQDNFTDAQSGTTQTFSFSAPSGTEQIEIARSVIANSQNTSGQISCSSNTDCSYEEVTIEHPVTVSA